MSRLSDLRDRLAALDVDRAPLRRAGLFAVLLVVLLVVGRAFGPDRAALAAPDAERQTLQTSSEKGAGWTGGRVLALVLLAAGGGVALVLRRRQRPGASSTSAFTVIETHPLGTGHSLRLVRCGGEVLLLSVGSDGARLLRSWPADAFPAAPSFADVLAETTVDASDPAFSEPLPEPLPAAAETPDAPAPSAPIAEELGEAAPLLPVGRGSIFPARGLRQFGGAHA